MTGWTWDETLYSGSAAHYVRGRQPYRRELAAQIAAAVGLDGTERHLDVGCGPGSLTLLLAPYVAWSVGLDPDPGMLAEAERLASERGISDVGWRRLRAEELPADLAPVDLVTFAQSFHWMQRDLVAATVRAMLSPDGALVHVHADTNRGRPVADRTAPPWHDVDALVRSYLGPDRRAGRTVRLDDVDGEDEVYRRAGFGHAARGEVDGELIGRDVEQLVSSVHSLSWAAPHLFGDRLAVFDADLRALLRRSAPADGLFVEQLRPVAFDVWR